jgi:hypothetical protein
MATLVGEMKMLSFGPAAASWPNRSNPNARLDLTTASETAAGATAGAADGAAGAGAEQPPAANTNANIRTDFVMVSSCKSDRVS